MASTAGGGGGIWADEANFAAKQITIGAKFLLFPASSLVNPTRFEFAVWLLFRRGVRLKEMWTEIFHDYAYMRDSQSFQARRSYCWVWFQWRGSLEV